MTSTDDSTDDNGFEASEAFEGLCSHRQLFSSPRRCVGDCICPGPPPDASQTLAVSPQRAGHEATTVKLPYVLSWLGILGMAHDHTRVQNIM